MKTTDDLPIPSPCAQDWATMNGDERRRFCAACREHVTDLSTMTRAEAVAFVAAQPDACVQYSAVGDTLLFQPTPPRPPSLRRPGPLLRRAATVGALLAAGSPALASSNSPRAGSLIEWVTSWWYGEPAAEAPEQPIAEAAGAQDHVEHVVDTGLPPEPPATAIPELSQPERPVPTRTPPVRVLRGRPAPPRDRGPKPSPPPPLTR